MSHLKSIIALTTALTLTSGFSRADVFFGSQTSTSTGDIYPGGGIRNGAFDFHGGEGILASNVYVDDSVTLDADGSGPWNRGVGAAAALLSTSAAPPTCGSGASLTGNFSTIDFGGRLPIGASIFAASAALAPFQYIGVEPTNLTLRYAFTANVHINPQDTHLYTRAYGQVSVWDDGVGTYSTDSEVLQMSGGNLVNPGASKSITINEETSGPKTRYVSISFDVNPGDIFYVLARTGATSMYGDSFADGMNTFEGEFDQSHLVRSLVPSPANLSVGGLAVLAAARRRRA